MASIKGIEIIPLEGVGELRPGDDLAAVIRTALLDNGISLVSGDVLVVTQKIVSKVENRFVRLDAVAPSARARELAEQTRKDPRLVELILAESTAIVRARPGVLIVRHRSGHVMANAGIDASNLTLDASGPQVLLLPEDAEASAEKLQQALATAFDAAVGVVISDSFGRPWRVGVTNVAIAAAGLPALVDLRQQKDRHGRPMEVTQVAVADLLASAAGLMMGEADEGRPVIVIRNLPAKYNGANGRHNNATTLVRPLEEDLFQ